ncbi:mevalonate kinase [Streptococcus hillyeri]|uniref:Mevalonate kinase n=1 Tax=Streptococcus hillyeri TaxID=2282420 RepID=A0A3L9DPC7_9STRE|nr:mevalonate kinase [Streptococcus hillyeri]
MIKQSKIGVGKAHSKIILMGEHAVVYGYPAIALPLKNIEVTCRIKPADKRLLFDATDPLVTAIFAALRYLEIKDEPITYEIESMVPERRGMGSSAAVAIAAIRAVFDYFDQPLSMSVLEMLANQAEIIAHTNPSGLDAKTCLSDTAIKFIRNVGFSEVVMDLKAYLVIADTGIHGHTREAVQAVEALEEKALIYLHHLGDLVNEAEKAIFLKDLNGFGEAMFKAHDNLKQLGVSSPEADHLVSSAMSKGALGAKMSGGGLGGCIIALTESQESAIEIAQHLKKEGAVNTWIESL